jgi:signal transduction histidine kinase
MRRRILGAIIGVTILATSVLTVPLAIVVSRRAAEEGVHELERVAERTATDISPESLQGLDEIELPDTAAGVAVAVYTTDGRLIVGKGPDPADEAVLDTQLLTRSHEVGHSLVVTRPVVLDETTSAVIRASEPLSETRGRVRRELALLLAFDAVALVTATAVGWFVARRLVKPLDLIRDDAARLGAGDFAIEHRHSGVSELDATSAALADTAERLDDTLRHEREFTANASHQLRTPITALRVSIEGELMAPRDDHTLVLDESLAEIDRLESTISTLLEVARTRDVERTEVELSQWASANRVRWQPRLSSEGRNSVFTGAHETVRVSREVMDEIADVLIDNALEHGDGEVRVQVSGGGGVMSLTVADDGELGRDPASLFVRHDPAATGTGVGLALARSLAEAEGGRLVVSSTAPTRFRLVLPDWSASAQHH